MEINYNYYDNRMHLIQRMLMAVKRNGSTGTTKFQLLRYDYDNGSQSMPYGNIDDELLLMTENNLLDYDDFAGRYRITEKGLDFLKTVDKMKKLLSLVKEE
jgi:predicted transcriptional regulator